MNPVGSKKLKIFADSRLSSRTASGVNYKNRVLALLLMVMLLVPVLPTKTEAQFGIPTVDQGLNPKEVGITAFGVVIPGLTLDLIAITIARTLLESILNSTIDWINSGFEGNPAFVTDPEQFFTNIADGIAGEFIAGSDLNFLCSPFQAQIRLSLQRSYATRGPGSKNFQFQCTLSEIAENLDEYFNDVTKGGLDEWFYVTQNNANNPYGAYIEAELELSSRLARALGVEDKKLTWDGGFLSWGECVETDPDTGECKGGRRRETPGIVIESQLEHVLGTGVRQLELADEFDELVSALVGQLLQKFVFGSEGLLGGGGGGGGGTTPPQNPTVTLSANPIVVPSGGSSTLTWSASNAASCTASGGWSGQVALSGSRSVGPLFSDQIFTISCSSTRGTVSRSVSITVGGSGGPPGPPPPPPPPPPPGPIP